MSRNLYPYIFERFDADENPIIQANYDDAGTIGEIFVYNALVDDMVKVDVEVFERRHVAAYAILQTQIDGIISDSDFQAFLKFGT